MANKTNCQTPDTQFYISINENKILCEVVLPFDLPISEDEAIILETNIHNSLEIILSKYFYK